MREFREDLLTDKKLGVHCKTEQEAIELLTWADSKGKKCYYLIISPPSVCHATLQMMAVVACQYRLARAGAKPP